MKNRNINKLNILSPNKPHSMPHRTD